MRVVGGFHQVIRAVFRLRKSEPLEKRVVERAMAGKLWAKGIETVIINRVNTDNRSQPVVSVLLGTSEPHVKDFLQIIIAKILQGEFEARFTIKERDVEIREANLNHHFDLFVLFVNTVLFESGGRIMFDGALDLIRQAKQRQGTIVLAITSFSPAEFAGAAEEAGADAIIDAPFTVADIERAVRPRLAVLR